MMPFMRMHLLIGYTCRYPSWTRVYKLGSA
nr:MAG TPA: hypothetical protein [Caudoviricetes sp.]